MADRFSNAVKVTLALRAAGRCSNPDCGAVTSGPGLEPDRAINVGVAAHITAASPGGPRYDPALTAAERAAAPNGIWLCQTCGKLIDSDVPRYTMQVLRQWKAEVERRAAEMLAAGLGSADDPIELDLPSLETPDSLLSFANPHITRVGREDELAELDAFLGTGRRFAWWLWTGPSGVGKSRLAIELCRAVSGTWHAGFLRDVAQSRLGSLQALRPTLVVVDYAAQRGAWLSDALFQLSQRDRGAPVRVLVLERAASGPWWDTVQRLNRFEESEQVAASSYALPRALGGVSRGDARSLIRDVAAQAGIVLSSTNVEDIADHAESIDPSGRPLFALIAAIDWLDENGVSAGRDTALRRLLSRMDAQTAERLPSSMPPGRVRNLRTLATALGGVSVGEYAGILKRLQSPAGLLPGVFDDFQAVSVDELLDGVRPDILGELYVLDRLAAGSVEQHAAMTLLRLAWQASQDAYHAFVERTAADHRGHGQLTSLLDIGECQESPVPVARLTADTVPLLRRSDHPALTWIFDRLTTLQEASRQPEIDEIVVTARFRFANLVHGEGDASRANELYTAALADCEPAWPVHTGILNNRGITWLQLDRQDAGVADFTTVIDATTATDEARACALNNRADTYDDDDPTAAVIDRTAVLKLAETTYNRRYIALARRARALWRLGKHADAYQDIDTILATADIAMEQKMAARLQRAQWLIASGTPASAAPDLETVTASNRNFDSVESRAHELLATLPGR